ncbi:hypothetical protein VST7929_01878 [Vibrio stylophorae]|uniref:UPF0208 membrane protein VST7929_01878 n=1 Tax=Vibrio stylophorae TaxID=659351 RepID=A0ABN8DVF6_9VIBR|nr:terminus macrodomain insulation protein YfbV [Vibrio stylophorae]CAH0533996.1 hypothetical protein VST7929_01878 [Vibrio stylophorae]
MQQGGFLKRFGQGQRYMNLWPQRKELNPMFPEGRVIRATQFALRVTPAIAVIGVLLQMVLTNQPGLPQAVVTGLFALSLPLQGLWWLGSRSQTMLPPGLAAWYRELHQTITQEGIAVEPLKAEPRYQELAQILSRAFKKLDKHDLERWF